MIMLNFSFSHENSVYIAVALALYFENILQHVPSRRLWHLLLSFCNL